MYMHSEILIIHHMQLRQQHACDRLVMLEEHGVGIVRIFGLHFIKPLADYDRFGGLEWVGLSRFHCTLYTCCTGFYVCMYVELPTWHWGGGGGGGGGGKLFAWFCSGNCSRRLCHCTVLYDVW